MQKILDSVYVLLWGSVISLHLTRLVHITWCKWHTIYHWNPWIMVVQFISRVRLFATPWTAAHQAFLSFIISWTLLKLMSIEMVMPSNHLILCHPLLLQPSIFPSSRVFSWYWERSWIMVPSDDYLNLQVEQWSDLYLIQRKPGSLYHWLLKYILYLSRTAGEGESQIQDFLEVQGEILLPGPFLLKWWLDL